MKIQGFILKKELLVTLAIVIWGIYFIIKCKKNKGNINKKFILNNIFKLIFMVYISLVIGITLFPIRVPALKNYNIKPVINLNVLTIFDYGFNKYAIINILGNIALLAPLPILLFLSNSNNKLIKIKNLIPLLFITSLSIEVIQYFESYFKIVYNPRASDIIDLILNILGGLLGYCVLKIYQRNTKRL